MSLTDLQAIVAEHEAIHDDLATASERAGGANFIPVAEREALVQRTRTNIDNIIDLLTPQSALTLLHMGVEIAEVILDGPHEEEHHQRIAGSAVRLLQAVQQSPQHPLGGIDLGVL